MKNTEIPEIILWRWEADEPIPCPICKKTFMLTQAKPIETNHREGWSTTKCPNCSNLLKLIFDEV